MKTPKTFHRHLSEMQKDEKFSARFDEEKRLLALSIEIAEFRQQQGLSQKELAEKSGISQQHISKLERGENFNITTFLKVCHALGVNVALQAA